MIALETVIFDLGNVLLPFDWSIPSKRMSERTGCSQQELQDYITKTPFLGQLELGQLTAQQFFEIVARDLRFTGSRAEFDEIWSNIFTIDAAMVQLTQSLKGSYRRFVLSNTLPQHIEFVFAKYPVLQDFDGHILSYEVGLVKPDRRIYELTMQRFGIAAERAVFIDDLPANVAAARATGLQAIHHKSFQKTRRELTRLGIPNI
ncbi:MAG: HAD family phosphatase [Verrucomicrobiota bacterium]|jgi:glucose-1-phosphatase